MKLSTACKKAAAIIDRPGKWQKGEYGFLPNAFDHGCYCMSGAIAKVTNTYPGAPANALAVAVGGVDNLPDFNDDPDTTQDDAVLGLLVIGEFLKAEGL